MTSESRSADDELPDIVDIVRNVVDAFSPALPAHVEQLADRARAHLCRNGELGEYSPRLCVRLVKQTAVGAGVRGDLSEIERAEKFSGHSLRAGLASSAESAPT